MKNYWISIGNKRIQQMLSDPFEDRGENYRPVIFYAKKEQRMIAKKNKQTLAESGRFDEPIVTMIESAKPFYLAEDEHPDYYKRNPENYKRNHARRAVFIKDNWEEKE